MATRAAYHKINEKQGRFAGRNYYRTKKKTPSVGDVLYIIEGEHQKEKMSYFLEGRYFVDRIDDEPDNVRRLILKPDIRLDEPASINDQEWFNNREFHNFFTAGPSMNPVRLIYQDRFNQMLRNAEANSAKPEVVLDAINDIGTDFPDRALVVSSRYARDPKIRRAVLARANGSCEYCGKEGFLSGSGDERYLESHHIIALANDGVDRMTNVIALCPNDHREVHFGKRGAEMEKQMIQRVKLLEGGRGDLAH